jgi:hypothetical protein
MSTSWTLLASEVCTDALLHMGVLDVDETADASQLQTCLRGLDTVLKELPLAGYTWPKLSGEVTLTWASVQAMALPSDYYGNAVAWRVDGANRVAMTQIPHATWVQMPDRAATGEYATHFYISPAGTFNVWPVPSTDPAVYLQYQKIVDDASQAVTPDVMQSWKGALGYGVANECALKFSVPQPRRVEIAQRWQNKKQLALQNAIPHEVISFEVRE